MPPPKVKAKNNSAEILKLLEQHARCEALARFPQFAKFRTDGVCYAHRMYELYDEIRVLAFGTSDVLELAGKWGLLSVQNEKNKANK